MITVIVWKWLPDLFRNGNVSFFLYLGCAWNEKIQLSLALHTADTDWYGKDLGLHCDDVFNIVFHGAFWCNFYVEPSNGACCRSSSRHSFLLKWSVAVIIGPDLFRNGPCLYTLYKRKCNLDWSNPTGWLKVLIISNCISCISCCGTWCYRARRQTVCLLPLF